MFIATSFDTRTLANMEVALERACKFLPTGGGDHDTRRYIANSIIECAEDGDRTLGGLTQAARAAARNLCRTRSPGVAPTGVHQFGGGSRLRHVPQSA